MPIAWWGLRGICSSSCPVLTALCEEEVWKIRLEVLVTCLGSGRSPELWSDRVVKSAGAAPQSHGVINFGYVLI